MGLVPYMGCLFTAAIKHAQRSFFRLICAFKSQSPSGSNSACLTVSVSLYFKHQKLALHYLQLCPTVSTPLLCLYHSL